MASGAELWGDTRTFQLLLKGDGILPNVIQADDVIECQ